MSFETATPPMVVIELPLEMKPRIRIACANESEEIRVREWITSDNELHDLVDRVLRLAEEKRAA